jgi:hypothetical protein
MRRIARILAFREGNPGGLRRGARGAPYAPPGLRNGQARQTGWAWYAAASAR